jgi:hypothetical protein
VSTRDDYNAQFNSALADNNLSIGEKINGAILAGNRFTNDYRQIKDGSHFDVEILFSKKENSIDADITLHEKALYTSGFLGNLQNNKMNVFKRLIITSFLKSPLNSLTSTTRLYDEIAKNSQILYLKERDRWFNFCKEHLTLSYASTSIKGAPLDYFTASSSDPTSSCKNTCHVYFMTNTSHYLLSHILNLRHIHDVALTLLSSDKSSNNLRDTLYMSKSCSSATNIASPRLFTSPKSLSHLSSVLLKDILQRVTYSSPPDTIGYFSLSFKTAKLTPYEYTLLENELNNVGIKISREINFKDTPLLLTSTILSHLFFY